MDVARRFIVQDRETRCFIGADLFRPGEFDLVPFLNTAHLFDHPEDAALNGLQMCGEGYLIFPLFVDLSVGE